MARKTIPRSLVKRAEDAAEMDDSPQERTGLVAGAWRAGATAQLRADLDAAESDAANRVAGGRAELSLSPDQIDDPLGSDRRPDWRDQPAYIELKASIAANGQDVPVHVAPADPSWVPDPRDPFAVTGVRFDLLAGRRRLAALQELGHPVRAILVPVGGEGAVRHAAMLTRRWRENAEREDLSPFERLLAIGEMFEAAKTADNTTTAAAFGESLGLSESVISRARAVSARRADIIAAEKDPWALSNTALYRLLPRLDALPTNATPKNTAPTDPFDTTRRAGKLRVAAKVAKGTLTLTAKGLPDGFDRAAFGTLVDEILVKLSEEGQSGE